MKVQTLDEFTRKIRSIIRHPEKVLIRKNHIERDRIWRMISSDDVWKVLGNGKAEGTRESDQTVIWVGQDEEGRKIELLCSMIDDNEVDTLVIIDAASLRVGSAYEPEKDDEALMTEWLTNNPDYERKPTGKGVQRKLEQH